jgi:outer membrane protein assembly factor BamB
MFDQIRALDPDHYFTPGAKGYALLAQPRDGGRPRWSTRIPVRVQAMVVAGDRLFTAGPPDVIDPNDPLGAFEGRKGGIVNTFDTATGEKLFEANLAQPPVFNGMAAAQGRLYVTTTNGRVLCLAGQ